MLSIFVIIGSGSVLFPNLHEPITWTNDSITVAMEYMKMQFQ